MKHMLTDIQEADLRTAMRTLPEPLRAAALTVRREWFLAKARQYLFLRIAAITVATIFAVVLAAQLLITRGTTVATLLLPFLAMAASWWAAAGMQRARNRNLQAASILQTMENTE